MKRTPLLLLLPFIAIGLLVVPTADAQVSPVHLQVLSSPVDDAPAVVLLDNHSVERQEVERLLVLVEADGAVRRAELHGLDVTLEPGTSLPYRLDLPDLSLSADETVRFEVLTASGESSRRAPYRGVEGQLAEAVADPPAHRDEALDRLIRERDRRRGSTEEIYPVDRLLEAQGQSPEERLEAMEGYRAQQETGDDRAFTDLQQCMFFCYDCTILGTRACTTGLERVECRCAEQLCIFECHPRS